MKSRFQLNVSLLLGGGVDALVIDDFVGVDVEGRAVVAAGEEGVFAGPGDRDHAGEFHGEVVFAMAGKVDREMIEASRRLGLAFADVFQGGAGCLVFIVFKFNSWEPGLLALGDLWVVWTWSRRR